MPNDCIYAETAQPVICCTIGKGDMAPEDGLAQSICYVEWLLSIISHVRRDGSQTLHENLYVPRIIRKITVVWMTCQLSYSLILW